MTRTTTDPIAQFAALRPTEADIQRTWPTDRRDAVLDRILQEHGSPADRAVTAAHPIPTRTTPRRRLLITAGGVAAAVAAILAIPLVMPSGAPAGPPTAQALEALAVTAADEPPLLPGQFRHEIVTEAQNGTTVTRESWTSADGTLWRHDSARGASMYYKFHRGGNHLSDPSPSFLAGLSTDPAALGSYLRTHVHGSTSRDEAVFVAVRDMLYGGFARPTLRAAALRVLESTDHVTAQRAQDPAGQATVKVSFVDQHARPGEVQTLYFDTKTARIVQESTTAPGLTYLRTVTASGITDAVPSSVLHFATTSPGRCIIGGRLHSDHECITAFDPGPSGTGTAAPTAPTHMTK